MNSAVLSIKNPLICSIFMLIALIGGWLAFENMARFEDPEFTIRVAKVITQYPGASPQEVLDEVTEPLESALQQLAEVETVESRSSAGLSDISVEIRFKDSASKEELKLIWTKVRNKISDAQNSLPPGAQPTQVNDDFGDVYGVYYLLTGEGYTPAELVSYAKTLRKELLRVDGVAKVAVTGEQEEVIYVEVSRARAAALGVSLNAVYATLSQQNTVSSSGDIVLGSERVVLRLSGEINSVEAIENVIVNNSGNGSITNLGAVANVVRGYKEPTGLYIRHDGQPALAIGISNVSGANVVKLGQAIDARLAEIENLRPVGMELHEFYHQGKVVDEAIVNFAWNVVAALVIVFMTLLIFMGYRSGLVMGMTVLITMAATLLIMWIAGIPMHRISLGALVISLGMLVDNGVVITDGILVGIHEGRKKLDIAKDVAQKNMKPLLGGTLVGIIAFAPIGFSPGEVGEYTGDLFWVVMIALGLSWVFAFTFTPLLCYWMFPEGQPKAAQDSQNEEEHGFYKIYKKLINAVLQAKRLVIIVTIGVFCLSVWGFQFVKDGFFPSSTSPQIVVDYYLPEGTDIERTNQDMKRMEDFVRGLEGVEQVQTIVGGGTLRYMLVYQPAEANGSVGQLLIQTSKYELNDGLIAQIQNFAVQNFPDGQTKAWKFLLGPGGGSKIEAQFTGPEARVLRRLANEAKEIMANDPDAIMVKDDWRRQLPIIEPIYSQTKGERAGITRLDITQALEENFSGRERGILREGDDLIKIISRAPEAERIGPWSIASLQVLGANSQQSVPLAQVLENMRLTWRDANLLRIDRALTITAQTDPGLGVLTADLFERLRPQIEAIELPEGYHLEWKGEYGDSSDAQGKLASTLPLGLLAMVLVVVFLFNSVRQPLIIWFAVPLAIVGVVVGLVITQTPLEFMGILGLLSLSGLLIQNSLVLVDSIDNNIADGMPRYEALLNSSASRLRPVTMGAFTTVLGVLPLYFDAFFRSMTVVLVFGLTFATLITLLVTPSLYALMFGIHKNEVSKPIETSLPEQDATA